MLNEDQRTDRSARGFLSFPSKRLDFFSDSFVANRYLILSDVHQAKLDSYIRKESVS